MSKDVQGVREFAKQEPRGRVFHAGYRLDNVKAGGSGYGDSRNSKWPVGVDSLQQLLQHRKLEAHLRLNGTEESG